MAQYCLLCEGGWYRIRPLKTPKKSKNTLRARETPALHVSINVKKSVDKEFAPHKEPVPAHPFTVTILRGPPYDPNYLNVRTAF